MKGLHNIAWTRSSLEAFFSPRERDFSCLVVGFLVWQTACDLATAAVRKERKGKEEGDESRVHRIPQGKHKRLLYIGLSLGMDEE